MVLLTGGLILSRGVGASGTSRGHIRHLGLGKGPNHGYFGPSSSVLMCVPGPHLGPPSSTPLLVQSTSVAVPLLVPGPVLPPGTQESQSRGRLSHQFQAPVVSSGAPGCQCPCRVPERRSRALQYRQWQERRGLASHALS